jgi:ABC-type glycerol-3-phosphate transport system substrate-binding protein
MPKRQLTRRQFLAKATMIAGGIATASLLTSGATCGPTPTPEVIKETVIVEKPVEKVVKETVVKEVVKEVTMAPEVKTPITMRFLLRSGPQGSQMVEATRLYMEANPHITVNVEDASWGDIPKKTELLMVGGQLPDALWGQGMLMPYYSFIGAYRELDDIIAAKNYDMGVYFPWLVDGHCKFEGKVHSLPTQPNCGQGSCTWVNVSLLEKNGIELPGDDWTMDEFRELCLQVNDPDNNIFAYEMSWHMEGLQSFSGSFGGKFTADGPHTGLGRECVLTTDPKTVEGLQFFLDMRLKDRVMPLADEVLEGGSFKMWQAGNLVFADGNIGSVQGLPGIIQDRFKWTVLLGPIKPPNNRGSANNTVSFFVGNQTKNPEEAFDLIALCTSTDISTWHTLVTGKQPGGRFSDWQDPRIVNLPLTGPIFKKYGEWLAEGPIDMRAAPWNLRVTEWWDMFHQEGQFVNQGIKTWDEWAPEFQRKADDIFAKDRP